jgi:dTDP-4-amino-4,6-dideoxygalactose transaminase
MTVLSFHPVKHITTGEGGAIVTNSADLYAKLKQLRNHGIVKNEGGGAWYYEVRDLGFNYRLTDLQSALGMSQLSKLDCWVGRRQEIAAMYDERLREIEDVLTPYQAKSTRSSYHLYVIQVPCRRRVFENLRARGIGVQVHYLPVHLHPIYRERLGFCPGAFPIAENYYEHAISLPIFPKMSEMEILRVVEEVKQAVEN